MTEDADRSPDVLASRQRRMLLALIRANPGARVTDIMAHVPFHWGSMSYHLRRLEEAGLIRVEQQEDDGRTSRLYPASPADPIEATPAPPPALRGLSRAILEHVVQNPGCGFPDLVAALDTSPRNIHYHLKRLLERGLVESHPSRYRDLRVTPRGLAKLPGEKFPLGPEAPPEVPRDLLWRVMQAVRTAPSIAVTTLRDLLRVPESQVRHAVDALVRINRVRVQEVDGTLRVWPA